MLIGSAITEPIFFILGRYFNVLRIRDAFVILTFLLTVHETLSQKQLVLLRKESVILRRYPGDEFIFKLKGSDARKTSYVNTLSDTAVVTHGDTIPFHRIESVYFKRDMFSNRLGRKLVAAGVVYMLFDQLNVVVVQGNEPRL